MPHQARPGRAIQCNCGDSKTGNRRRIAAVPLTAVVRCRTPPPPAGPPVDIGPRVTDAPPEFAERRAVSGHPLAFQRSRTQPQQRRGLARAQIRSLLKHPNSSPMLASVSVTALPFVQSASGIACAPGASLPGGGPRATPPWKNEGNVPPHGTEHKGPETPWQRLESGTNRHQNSPIPLDTP